MKGECGFECGVPIVWVVDTITVGNERYLIDTHAIELFASSALMWTSTSLLHLLCSLAPVHSVFQTMAKVTQHNDGEDGSDDEENNRNQREGRQ